MGEPESPRSVRWGTQPAETLHDLRPAQPVTDDPLLLMPEVSAITRIPIDTLRYLRHRGEGPPSFRLGRRVVSRRSAVLRWIEEHEQAATA